MNNNSATLAPQLPTHVAVTAADCAEQFLYRYESELERSGVTERGVPTAESCANFVTAMLELAHEITWHTNAVAELDSGLRRAGWTVVATADARRGDVWICNGAGGEQHTEIVSSNNRGRIVLIGSNNHPFRDNQQINYDSYSATIPGSYILTKG